MGSRSSLEREVLHWGLVDWVMACDVEGAARAVGGAVDMEGARDMSVSVIRKLLVEGFFSGVVDEVLPRFVELRSSVQDVGFKVVHGFVRRDSERICRRHLTLILSDRF